MEVFCQGVDELRLASYCALAPAVVHQRVFWQFVVINMGTRQRKLQTQKCIADLVATWNPSAFNEGLCQITEVDLHEEAILVIRMS